MKRISKMTFKHIDDINIWFEQIENKVEIINIQYNVREINVEYIVFYYNIKN
ncbi:hypothetical protein M0Q50_09895 [bacterium]|jgi:hypothetical protein|nr:hypothetical protein [bacterium]